MKFKCKLLFWFMSFNLDFGPIKTKEATKIFLTKVRWGRQGRGAQSVRDEVDGVRQDQDIHASQQRKKPNALLLKINPRSEFMNQDKPWLCRTTLEPEWVCVTETGRHRGGDKLKKERNPRVWVSSNKGKRNKRMVLNWGAEMINLGEVGLMNFLRV